LVACHLKVEAAASTLKTVAALGAGLVAFADKPRPAMAIVKIKFFMFFLFILF
jgi:hypothetical protein